MKTPLTMIEARMETVRREISRLEAELDRLKIAGEVMAELAGMTGKQAPLLAAPTEHKAGFTIRRTVNPAPAAKEKRPRRKMPDLGNVSAMILSALEHGEKLKSAEIAVKLFGEGDAHGRKRVWQTCSSLKRDGYLNRDEAGYFSRVHVTTPAATPVAATVN